MRLFDRLLALFLTALVAACSTNPQAETKRIDQSGNLKVAPELVGKPTAEARPAANKAAATTEAAGRQRQN